MSTDKVHLAYCQKWKTTSGKSVGCTLHVDKPIWRQFMRHRVFVLNHDYFQNRKDSRDATLKSMGLSDDLVPDGNPYWCRVSEATRELIVSAMWPEPDRRGLGKYGVKFDGQPKKFWGLGEEGLRRKALSKLSPQEREILGLS